MEDALIEMCLAGTFDWRVEDIFEALWGSKSNSATIGERNKKAYIRIENWRNCPLPGGNCPYYVRVGFTCAITGAERLKMQPF